MRAGQSAPAHWIKISGVRYFTTACQRVLARDSALGVETAKIAGAVGKFYLRPKSGDICPECERKAKAQA